MNNLDALEVWARSLRKSFEATGVSVHFERSTDARPKHSAALNLRRGQIEADLLVWDSGEAELSTMDADGNLNQEYFENLQKPEDLASLLCRIVSLVKLIDKRM